MPQGCSSFPSRPCGLPFNLLSPWLWLQTSTSQDFPDGRDSPELRLFCHGMWSVNEGMDDCRPSSQGACRRWQTRVTAPRRVPRKEGLIP